MSPASEAALVARCRAGDHAAWDALVEQYARYVYAIALQAFRLQPADAEDVFQEVFLRAYERVGSLRDDGALRPWLAQLTRNCCIDRLRRDGRERPTEDAGDGSEADETLERIDEAMAIRDALDRLSPECREVLDRFFCRDESYRTIGAALGLPGGTIASRISRCLTKLRLALEGRNPGSPASGAQVER